MHSLKPNKQRVLGAYAYLYGILKVVSEKSDSLRAAIDADRAARVDPVPIAWDYDSPAPMVEWPIFEYEVVTNPVLGIQQMVWSDVPLTITVEQSTRSTPSNPPRRPFAYVIPAVWTAVIEVLAIHGIQMERLTDVTTIDVTNYRMEGASMNRLREGRPEISPGDVVPENCTRTYGMNDLVVKTDQPLGTLAVALLEPSGESSLFLWGFFSSTLTSHEYPENYIMIPLAEKMLNESAELIEEWESYKDENPS
ncbi:peptidase M14 carboxypeptidase family protein [Nitzschia inconspicua]|uniref:Peptidase M14 carboxypeptidase family protein n=1 Tax=Nitzschia inconspicua TaxID=303405 RepID=A0A9K3PGU3_9STRA|nr:peptidase M14 carboxypeptidase family protein [Nitzschia inconspicua]